MSRIAYGQSWRYASASTASGEHLKHGEADDLEVQQNASAGDVLQVAPDHAVEPGAVTLRHLPETGDAGLHGQALQVVLGVLLHLARQGWAGAHHRHLAQEDVEELGELVDRVFSDEPPDPGDPRVLPHLEHRALDLVLLLELGEAGVGVLVHAAELPHAEGGEAAVAVGLPHADLAVEGVALALQADGRRENQARHGDHGEYAPAEADVERALHKAVAQARAVPVLYVLHRLEALFSTGLVHGLCHKCRSRRRTSSLYILYSQNQIYVPGGPGIPLSITRLSTAAT